MKIDILLRCGENTCMTVSFHKEGMFGPVNPFCLYIYSVPISLTLELFWRCGIFFAFPYHRYTWQWVWNGSSLHIAGTLQINNVLFHFFVWVLQFCIGVFYLVVVAKDIDGHYFHIVFKLFTIISFSYKIPNV